MDWDEFIIKNNKNPVLLLHFAIPIPTEGIIHYSVIQNYSVLLHGQLVAKSQLVMLDIESLCS